MGCFSPESSEPRKIWLVSKCPEKLAAKYRKCRPAGRKRGQRWLDSKRAASVLVTSTGVPPAEETRDSPVKKSGENKMTPSRFQAPPRPWGASHNTCAVPPEEERSTFLSFP